MADLVNYQKEDLQKFMDRVSAWKKVFGLINWNIYVQGSLVKELLPDNETGAGIKTIADPRYNSATMIVYPAMLAKESEWDEKIVHELIHICMALYDFFADNLGNKKEDTDELFFISRENSVSMLTNVIMRIIKENSK